MTRDEAVTRLESPELDHDTHNREFEYVARKLGLSVSELREIFQQPKKTFRDYRNKRALIVKGANFLRMIGLEKRYFR